MLYIESFAALPLEYSMSPTDIKRALELHEATRFDTRNMVATACVVMYDILALGVLYVAISFIFLSLPA